MVGGILLALVAVLAGVTLYLTPERLTKIVNEQASKHLNADVKTSNIQFTFWSSFPRLCVRLDSVRVRSRNFDSLPDAEKKALPDNADFLMSSGRIAGDINVIKLIEGDIRLGDVTVDSLRLNLVALNDTLNNYAIAPPDTAKLTVPNISARLIALTSPARMDYHDVGGDMKLGIDLDQTKLAALDNEDYATNVKGLVSVSNRGMQLLRKFPVELAGDVKLLFDPVRVSTKDYLVNLGKSRGKVTLSADFDNDVTIKEFAYQLEKLSLGDVLELIPRNRIPALRGIDPAMDLTGMARLSAPYKVSSSRLPSLEAVLETARGRMAYTASDGTRYDIDNIAFTGRLVYDGKHPETSYFELPHLNLEGEGLAVNGKAIVRCLTGNPEIAAEVTGHSDLKQTGKMIAALRPYGLSGDVDVKAGVKFTVRGKEIVGTEVKLNAGGDGIGFVSAPYTASADGVKFATEITYSDALTFDKIPSDLPVSFTLAAGKARFADSGDTVRLQGVGLKATAMKLGVPVKVKKFVEPAKWTADRQTLEMAGHTARVIDVAPPQALVALMSGWDGNASVKVKKGKLDIAGYPGSTYFSNVDLSATLDSVRVRNLKVRTVNTEGRIRGRVSNLRQFLIAPGAAPLAANFDVALDTVEFNHLAKTYNRVHPEYLAHPQPAHKLSDTLAYLVPRNLQVDVRLSAKHAKYYNLDFHDLSTRIVTADGNATLDSLKIGTDFGDAMLTFHYNTADMQRMAMHADFGIDDVELTDFYKDFRTLVAEMPELKNLDAVLSAECSGGLYLFPSMYFNVPSLGADIEVTGRDIDLHQNEFIRKVTKMMLIPDGGDLHINDIDIHARVRDNLLEVYPFDFEFSKYHLRLGGLNNFNGELFYHIGVLDWPFKMPFGINIKGQYHNPELRFGGAHWKAREGATITERVIGDERINLVAELRQGLQAFVRKAAEYREGDSF